TAGGAGNQLIRVTDAAAPRPVHASVIASGPNHQGYQISSFSDIRDALADVNADSLSGAGSPFPAGDMTCAHQWGVMLSSAGSDGDALNGSLTFDITVDPDVCAQADFDGNGLTQPADVALFVNRWLTALQGGCP